MSFRYYYRKFSRSQVTRFTAPEKNNRPSRDSLRIVASEISLLFFLFFNCKKEKWGVRNKDAQRREEKRRRDALLEREDAHSWRSAETNCRSRSINRTDHHSRCGKHATTTSDPLRGRKRENKRKREERGRKEEETRACVWVIRRDAFEGITMLEFHGVL